MSIDRTIHIGFGVTRPQVRGVADDFLDAIKAAEPDAVPEGYYIPGTPSDEILKNCGFSLITYHEVLSSTNSGKAWAVSAKESLMYLNCSEMDAGVTELPIEVSGDARDELERFRLTFLDRSYSVRWRMFTSVW